MSDPITPTDDEQTEAPSTVDLDTVIFSFLEAVPEPTDEQLESFATLLGMDYKVFEERVFKLVGDGVNDLEDEDLDELTDDDPLSTFILSFFMLNPEPSEEQVHALAELAGMTPEQLEEAIYALLTDLSSDDESEDEEDEDGEEDDTDEDTEDEAAEEEDEEEDLDSDDGEDETTDTETEEE